MMEMLSVNRVVGEWKAGRAVLKNKTMALSDLLVVFRAACPMLEMDPRTRSRSHIAVMALLSSRQPAKSVASSFRIQRLMTPR